MKNLPSSDPVYQDYIHASKKQKGIHFVGMKKPWSDARIPHARSWWEFAKETPFLRKYLNVPMWERKQNGSNSFPIALKYAILR